MTEQAGGLQIEKDMIKMDMVEVHQIVSEMNRMNSNQLFTVCSKHRNKVHEFK